MRKLFIKTVILFSSFILVFSIIGMPAWNSSVVQYASAEEEPSYFALGDFSVFINPDGKTMSIRSCYLVEPDKCPEELKIPSSFNYKGQDYKVTKLAPEFEVNNKVTSLIIPEGIEEIGQLFGQSNNNINSISLPASLNVIKPGAFNVWELGNNLTTVTIAEGNTVYKSINNAIYSMDGKTLVAAPCARGKYKVISGVKTIGAFCFYGNRYVTKITIPKGVKAIEESAFDSMEESLKEVVLPDTITSIGKSAFSNCTGLTKLNIPKVTKISDSVFYNTGLKTIAVPEGIEEIGAGAFASCTKITKISLPSTIKKLDPTAFNFTDEYSPDYKNNLNPSNVTISKNNKHFKIVKGGLLSKDGTIFYKLIASDSTYTLPKTVKTIETGAFSNNHQVDKVVIKKGVKKIPDSAFASSTVMQVELPDGISTIGNNAFAGTKIHYLNLPDGVKTIGKSAFYWSQLKYITIPNSVKSIGDNAFNLEYGRVQVHFLGKTPPTLGYFSGSKDSGSIKAIIPLGTKESYTKELSEKNRNNRIKILEVKSKKVQAESDCYARIIVTRITNANIIDYTFSLNGKDYQKNNFFNSLTPKKTYTVYAKKGSQILKTKVKVGSMITYNNNNYIVVGEYYDFISGYEYKIDNSKWRSVDSSGVFRNLKAGKHTLYRRKESDAKKNLNKVVKETFTIS